MHAAPGGGSHQELGIEELSDKTLDDEASMDEADEEPDIVDEDCMDEANAEHDTFDTEPDLLIDDATHVSRLMAPRATSMQAAPRATSTDAIQRIPPLEPQTPMAVPTAPAVRASPAGAHGPEQSESEYDVSDDDEVYARAKSRRYPSRTTRVPDRLDPSLAVAAPNAHEKYQVGVRIMTTQGPATITGVEGGREYEINYPHDNSTVRITAQDGKNVWLPEEFPDSVYDPSGRLVHLEEQEANIADAIASASLQARAPLSQECDLSDASLGMLMHAYIADTDSTHFASDGEGGEAQLLLRGKTAQELKAELKEKVKASTVNAALPRHWSKTFASPLRPLCADGEERELQDLIKIDTFGPPRPLPRGKRAIGLMWVLLAKSDAGGFFSKLKGRLTLMGNQERNTLERMMAYAPVQHIATLRVLLAMHINELKSVRFYQCDIKQAYLSAKMKREVYVRHPPGYKIIVRGDGKLDYVKLARGEKAPPTVMQLLLALYGGMECGRLFWEEYVNFHLSIGFTKIPHEPCFLQLVRENGDFIKLAFHVDDSAIASRGADLLEWYKVKLGGRFEYTMGDLEHFLGTRIEIDYEAGTIKMNQGEQTLKLLKQFGMSNAKPAKTPTPAGRVPSKADVPTDPAELAAVMKTFDLPGCVGGMNYLQCGTVGLTFPLKVLSRFLNAYGNAHISFCKHVLRWLKGQLDRCVIYRAGFPTVIQIFTDASHAGCVDTRRSISSVIIKVGGNTVFWKAVWQAIVSHSSTESELMALDKV